MLLLVRVPCVYRQACMGKQCRPVEVSHRRICSRTGGVFASPLSFSLQSLPWVCRCLRYTKAKALPYFLVCGKGSGTTIASVEEYPQFFANVPAELVRESPFPRLSSSPTHSRIKTQQTIVFLDPSADSTHPGSPLRNLLASFLVLYPTLIYVHILCWRDTGAAPTSGSWRSRFGILNTTTTSASTERPAAVGWEKNPQQKLGPWSADLALMIDPKRFCSLFFCLGDLSLVEKMIRL
jgi:hypothetical protein